MPGDEWKKIRVGTVNTIFFRPQSWQPPFHFDHKGPIVLKVPVHFPVAEPAREMRICKQLYPAMPVAAYSKDQDATFPKVEKVDKTESDKGWIMPGFQFAAKDKEDFAISKEILKIYVRERRIILNACEPNKVRKESENGPLTVVSYNGARRRGSEASDKYWKSIKDHYTKLDEYWRDYERSRPLSVQIIRTLVWLESFLEPASIKDEYLDYDLLMLFKIKDLETEAISEDTLKALSILHKIDYRFSTFYYFDKIVKDQEVRERLIKSSADPSFSAVTCLLILMPTRKKLLDAVADSEKLELVRVINVLMEVIPPTIFAKIKSNSILVFYKQSAKDNTILATFCDIVRIIKEIDPQLLTVDNFQKLLCDKQIRAKIIKTESEANLSARSCRKILEGGKIVPQDRWKVLGEGNYNYVYYKKSTTPPIPSSDHKGPYVLKIPNGYEASFPARATRLSKEINPSMPVAMLNSKQDDTFPHVTMREHDGGIRIVRDGWIMPYLPYAAGDDEDIAIAKGILDIYLRQKRILLDGCGEANFRKATQQGPVICIDYDTAIRRGSVVSDKYWGNIDLIHQQFSSYWDIWEKNKPESVNIIRVLVWLEHWLKPENIKNEYLDYEFLMLFCGKNPNLATSPDVFHAYYITYKINPHLSTAANWHKLANSQELREQLLKRAAEPSFSAVDYMLLLNPACKLFEGLEKQQQDTLIGVLSLLGRCISKDIIDELNPESIRSFAEQYVKKPNSYTQLTNALALMRNLDLSFNTKFNYEKLLTDHKLCQTIIDCNAAKQLTVANCMLILDPAKQTVFNNLKAKKPLSVGENTLAWLMLNFPQCNIGNVSAKTLVEFDQQFVTNKNFIGNLYWALQMIKRLTPKLLTDKAMTSLLTHSEITEKIIKAASDNTLSTISCAAIFMSTPTQTATNNYILT